MFNNPFQMVVAIVFITAIASILRAKWGLPDERAERRRSRMSLHGGIPAHDSAEVIALREEIRTLKDRVQVLERIATDTNNAVNLDREIERLRDR